MNFRTKFSIILMGCLLLMSCTKESENAEDNTSTSKVSETFKATVDGKSWEAKKAEFGGLSALITLRAEVDELNFISFQFVDTNLELNKTYSFDNKNLSNNLNGNVVLYVKGVGMFSQSGTFKITKYTRGKLIEGEMNAEVDNLGGNKSSLKNATFSIKY